MERFSLSCEDNPDGVATTETVIMMTNQQPNTINNYAIANYGPIDNVLSVSLQTECTSVEAVDENQDRITTSLFLQLSFNWYHLFDNPIYRHSLH